MHRLMALAALGTLIACGRADNPVAPLSATNDVVVTAAGAAVYTGRGTAVDATVLGVNTKLCDTGWLPRAGGRIPQNAVGAAISGVLSANALYCIALGGNNKAISEATLWQLKLTVGGNSITADHLHSMAGAWCPPVRPLGSSGASFVTNLRINGKAVSLRRSTPNQTFELPNGYVVFEEQRSFRTPWHAGRTVTGLRVVITTPGATADIALARSQTHIDCP